MKKIRDFLKIKTSRQVIVNTIGSYLNAFFSLAFTLILTRLLSRAEFGTQSVILAITYVATNILDFGVSGAIYSYLPTYQNSRQEAVSFLKSNLILQTILSSVAVIFLLPLIPVLNINILKTNSPSIYYVWAILGIPLFVMQNFALNSLYASQKFLEGNLYVNLSHLIKLIAIVTLMGLGKAGVGELIFLFAVVSPVIFLCLTLFRRRYILSELMASPLRREKIKLKYTSVFFAGQQLFNLATRMDLFLISYFLPQSSVGIYALSQKIIINIAAFVGAITQVLSPQFSLVRDKTEAIRLIKKAVLYLCLPAFLFVLLIITPEFVYRIFFTDNFVASAGVVRLLAISYIILSFVAAPVLFLLYTVRKPIYLLWANIVFLVISSVGMLIVIPQYGVWGPPLVFILAFAVNSVYIVWQFKRELNQLPKTK